MNDQLIQNCIELLGRENVLRKEPMSAHTSLRVGGPADLFLRVGTLSQLRLLLAVLDREKEPYYLLGRGTNLLVGDGGYRGCILTLAGASQKAASSEECASDPDLPGLADGEISDGTGGTDILSGKEADECLSLTGIAVRGSRIRAGAGESLSAVAAAARDYGLAGMEFASGIPGSVGGALVMNAGAYGGSMDQIVESALLLTEDGSLRSAHREALHFGYRRSLLKEEPAIALQITLKLQPDDPQRIEKRMRDLAARRREKQPLEYPSAGSTFKRPEGLFAGKLIMEAGLRGFAVGGAAVSEKHCGFVINRDHASAADVRAVIREVRRRVKENSGVSLEEEVISLGDFGVW